MNTELPSVTLTGFAINDTLSNIVNAKITGMHSKGIASINVFANDSLIASSTADSLSLTWNTLSVSDGECILKVVVEDRSANTKELDTRVILNNALLSIDQPMLISPFHETADYYITDSVGQLLSTANFSRSNLKGGGRISIYPKAEYTGQQINLIRVSKGADMNPIIEYFVDLKRGQYLNYKNLTGNFNYLNSKNPPVTITLKNTPKYDHVMVSTDATNYSLPLFGSSTPQLVNSPGTKVLVQIENENKAMYNLFDIPDGASQLELDAALCTLPSLMKTIKFPSAIEGAIFAGGEPNEGYSENYAVANKNFSGDSVTVFYPDSLIPNLHGSIQYSRKGIDFTHFYFNSFPENMDFLDIDAKIINSSISNFNGDLKGDFEYYRVIYANKTYTSTSDDGYAEIIVYAPHGQGQFNFPDISKEIAISGFNLSDFKPDFLQLYHYDTGSDITNHFNAFNNLVQPSGASLLIIAGINMQ